MPENSILDTLRSGTPRERLATASDIASLVGVSVASIAGGLVALTGSFNNSYNDVVSVLFAAVFALVTMGAFALAIAWGLALHTLTRSSEAIASQARLVHPLALTTVWAFLLAIVIVAAVYWHALLIAALARLGAA
jgi:hypothetical protein